MRRINKAMEKMIVMGTNWIKGFALLGMMAAMLGVFAASAPAASASVICSSDAFGKISVYAVDSSRGENVAGASVVVFNSNNEAVIKGTTDANGYFAAYSCLGTFKVKVYATGYSEYGQMATVEDGQSAVVKAELQRNSIRLRSR
jgi:hypothetical protein